MNTKRIFMSEADSSPGNGAPAADTPSPSEPTAAPTAPSIDVNQLVTALMPALESKFKSMENALFANARKAGMLGKEKPAEKSEPAPSAPQPAVITESDLDARLEQERVITRAQVEHKLSDPAVKRLKAALRADRPEDVSAWTATYLADLGLVRTSEPSTTATATVSVVPSAAPISDRGSPAPNGAAGWRYEIVTNPMSMSAGSRSAMDAELGVEKARKQRLDAARTQAERLSVVINPRG